MIQHYVFNIFRLRFFMKRKKSSGMFLFFFVFLLCAVQVSGQTRNLESIDTPTAFTAGKGSYTLSVLAYDAGGMEMKAVLGLHKMVHLGASFDVQHALGKDRPEAHIPGVIGRLKFTDGWETWPISVAIGYDSFYVGEQGINRDGKGSIDRMIYGPYLAVTKPVYLFDDEQYISFGVRTPVQPEAELNDTSYFLGLDFPLGDLFRFKAETERIFWNFRSIEKWMFNFGMRYTYMDQLGIEFACLLQGSERCNRILRIEYYDHF